MVSQNHSMQCSHLLLNGIETLVNSIKFVFNRIKFVCKRIKSSIQ